MLKKKILAGFLFCLCVFTANADDLANILQDLAVQIACIGRYSAAEAEPSVLVASRYTDPRDWYDPSIMAERFAVMSGNMTRITTFYGVCFDYAQFAWDYIKKYQAMYNKAGMKGQQWYIAATNWRDPNTIILYDPVPKENKEKATTISNGVYLKEKERNNVYAHDGANGHAWLWVQHNNGTWYWIDPTWTDNTGYVWWGIIQNGEEVQYYPDANYCIAADYPRPDDSRTRSSNSTYIESPNNTTAANRNTLNTERSMAIIGVETSYGLESGYELPGNYSLSLLFAAQTGALDWVMAFDLIQGNYDGPERLGFLVSMSLGPNIGNVLSLYGGAGVGLKFGGNDEGVLGLFAWKLEAGIMVWPFNIAYVKAGAMYDNVRNDMSISVGVGVSF
jgi:hypothetical protein